MPKIRLGIDLGGTKTEAVALRADGSEAARHRVATVRGSYPDTLKTISDLVGTIEDLADTRFDQVGLGIPGSVSPSTGLVRNANSTWINGKPLLADLSRVLERDVRISNDANCFALSECRDGAAIGATSVFAAILGTGVGGGLVLNGQIVEGAHGLGGEWGHVPLARTSDNGQTPVCFCGQLGCMEQYLSGPAIARDYLARGGAETDSVAVISERSQSGETLATECLARHLDRLARGLSTIINVFDPAIVVLGGGVSNLAGLVENLPAAIAPYVFAPTSDKIEIKIARALWGDSSGVRGAARLWEQV
ncbi:MAG: fructokinase [Paracoccaceae bacterium]|jgi:fructokinase